MTPVGSWRTGQLLAVAGRLTTETHRGYLARHGLTPVSFAILDELRDGALTQSELAARTRVEEQTLGRTVQRMQRDGLIERRRSPDDRRRVLVTATPRGATAHQDANGDAHDFEQRLLRAVGNPASLRAELIALVEDLGGAAALPGYKAPHRP